MKFLDLTGLTTLVNEIKAFFVKIDDAISLSKTTTNGSVTTTDTTAIEANELVLSEKIVNSGGVGEITTKNNTTTITSDEVEVKVGATSSSIANTYHRLTEKANQNDLDNLDDRVTEIEDAYVTGVKGSSESSYRTGDVNITKANIGLGNVTNYAQVTTTTTQTVSGAKTFSSKITGTAGIRFSGSDFYITNKSGNKEVGEVELDNSTNGYYLRMTSYGNVSASQGFLLAVGGTSQGFDNAVAAIEIYTNSSNVGKIAMKPTLELKGSGTYTGTWAKSSDIRLKENLEDISIAEAGALIDGVRTVHFNYKDRPAEKQIGVIAQDVESIFPEIIGSIEDGGEQYLTLDYSQLVTPLITCVRELRRKVAELEAKVKTLNGE